MPGETEYTTITVMESVKEDLDKERNGQPWSAFLEELRQEYADPITLNDVEEIADRLGERLDGDMGTGDVALGVADYLMTEYNLPEKVAEELEARQR